MKISIIGAGMSGLLAASHFQEAKIYEKKNITELVPHKALLRFRSDKIGLYLGIPFKEVKVNKTIWSEGKFVKPNPKVCNLYAQKVSGMICDRSIWNTDPCKRFIAPENFHEILLKRYSERISWKSSTSVIANKDEKVISTIPMYDSINKCGIEYDKSKYKFDRQSIVVTRYTIPNCNVYQTIYFPDLSTNIYRASISGDMLIVESINRAYETLSVKENVFNLFGLKTQLGVPLNINFIDETTQNNGKIGDMDDHERKLLIYRLSRDYGIYSLGRFAIWKNILLDDVWQDIQVIKQLMWKNNYELSKENLL